jgi:hypothetical protein
MKQLFILFLSTFCLIGCTSSNAVTGADQIEEINARGREQRATVTLMVDAVKAEYDADFVIVGRDTVQWVDPETGLARSAATVNLHRIRFTSRGTGALEGAGFGTLPGIALISLSLITGDTRSNASSVPSGLEFGLMGIFVGGGIGAGIGAIIAHKTYYDF